MRRWAWTCYRAQMSIKSTRRAFLAGAATLAAGCATSRATSTAARPPNIVYVFPDEHRYQSLSFTETPQVRTPNLARMAEEGTFFTHCISNYPVCSPHRAMLMSGRWPYQTGVIDNSIPLDPAGPTLGRTFQQSGYETGYIGKWHLGGNRAEPYGFDTSLIWTGTGQHFNRSEYHPASGPPVRAEGYNATVMMNQAVEFIDRHQATPFFLMLALDPPHSDFTDAPEDKKALYPPGSIPFRPNYVEHTDKGNVLQHNGSPYYEGYHAHITAVDEEMGRLLRALQERNLTEDTIVVYSSDHGSMHGSHGAGSKRQPYEESIRVPFLLHGPGRVPAGLKVDALFGTPDILPTLCGLAGVTVPAVSVGRDYTPWLRGEHGPDPAHQFIMHIAKDNASGGEKHPAPLFRGLRTKTHTYAVGVEGPMCLFDNVADPYQLNNLIGASEQAALRARLAGELKLMLAQAGDSFPVDLPAQT